MELHPDVAYPPREVAQSSGHNHGNGGGVIIIVSLFLFTASLFGFSISGRHSTVSGKRGSKLVFTGQIALPPRENATITVFTGLDFVEFL